MGLWLTIKLKDYFSLNYNGQEFRVSPMEKYSGQHRRGAKFEINNNGKTSVVIVDYGATCYVPEIPKTSFINLKPRQGGVMISVVAPEEVKILRSKLERKVT